MTNFCLDAIASAAPDTPRGSPLPWQCCGNMSIHAQTAHCSPFHPELGIVINSAALLLLVLADELQQQQLERDVVRGQLHGCRQVANGVVKQLRA